MSERKRNRQVCLRLTDEEFALWQKKCELSGLSQTEFLVSVLKNSTVKIYSFGEGLQPILTELRHIGGNINQLAYFSNIGEDHRVKPYIKDMQLKHSLAMEHLTEFLKKPSITVCEVK